MEDFLKPGSGGRGQRWRIYSGGGSATGVNLGEREEATDRVFIHRSVGILSSAVGFWCFVMANVGKRVDIQNLLSLGDDLVGVLKNKKDGDSLMQSLEGAKMLHSSCQSDSQDIRSLLEDYQKKINTYQEMIKKAKCETIADAELEQLQNELEDKLQEERLLCQELSDDLGDLEHQRVSIEERKEIIKKKEKEISTAQDLLSMCASVTSIIPNFEDEGKISGYVVERNKKKVEKFEFEPTASPIEVCNRLWKMA